MLTRTGRHVARGATAFLLFGVLFGNWPVFGAGALLVMLIAGSGLAKPPVVARSVDRARVERGGNIRFVIDVDVPRGLGVAELHQHLPDEFELFEGNNFHVITFGLRKRRERHEFVVRVPKRGEWTLPPVQIRVLHPAGFSTTPAILSGEPLVIQVEPRPRSAKIPRDLRTRARRPFPDGDIARLGVPTNEFRELREYVPGDPPRRINWKATARRMETGGSEAPLVNETELEGKKSVYILVDGHERLNVGTNLEDAREHAADAALTLMELYLRRGYQVGLATARSGALPPLMPGTGEAQVRRARELLARLGEAESPSFRDVMNRDNAVLHRGRPLVILVTRLVAADRDLLDAIKRIGTLSRTYHHNLVPGLIVDVEPPPIAARDVSDEVARRAMEADRTAARAVARAAGLRVTEWRAGVEPLAAVLVRGRIA